MKPLRIFIILIIGLATIDATPTQKPTPKSAESKKTLIVEEKKIDNPEKPKIDIENAEELKKGNRAKKSASTTFCVEIRPGATDGPNKVCDPPVPQQDTEIHENPPAPDPEPESPLFIIPPNPFAIYDSYIQPEQPPMITYIQPPIQQDPLPVQHLCPTAQVIFPPHIHSQHSCPPSPCPPRPCITHGVHRPHAQVTLYRSSNGSPIEDSMLSSSPDSKMEMKNNENDGKTSAMDNGILGSSEMQLMSVGPETVDPLFERTHHRRPVVGVYPLIYPSTGCQQTGQLIVPQYQRPSSGCGSTVIVASGRQSEERPEEALSMTNLGGLGSMTMDQPQMGVDMKMARTYSHYPTIAEQPMIGVLPVSGFNSNPTIYRPSSGYQTYQERYYDPYHSPSMISMSSGSRSMYRKDASQQTERKDENSNKMASEQETSKTSNSMSPSKMLNQMRSKDSQKTSPMMQSFLKENEDRETEKATQINVHIPSSGQAYVTGNGATNTDDEKISETSKQEEIGKKIAE